MINQSIQNPSHPEVIGGFHSSVDRLFCNVIERINTYRENQSQRALYSYYQKLTIDQLGDIGMSNPQDQLRILGSYLNAGTIDPCSVQTQALKIESPLSVIQNKWV